MTLLLLVLLPFVAASTAPLLFRVLGKYAAILFALVPAWVTYQIATKLPLKADAAYSEALMWVPDFGIQLAFRLDGLAAVFTLMISGIGTLIFLYASAYLGAEPRRLQTLIGLLLIFQGAMLGVVLSDDIITMFVFWELTSISSYMLIGFKNKYADSRNSARQALVVTGAGGLALLAGLVILSVIGRESGLSPTEASLISNLIHVDGLTEHSLFVPALILIAIGAFTKSAQFPFYFWLPNAMTAPTPVSAYLHSATMVKAGVYLLARLNPGFHDSELWQGLLATIGALTMLLAAAMSVGQTDLKRILAYTTVSILGTLTMLIGVGTDIAIKTMVVYLVAHACYKAALFLLAGTLEHAAGTRDIRELGGLLGKMPVSAVSAMIVALSMAGVPPLIGFIGKELLLKAGLDYGFWGIVIIVVATVANVFMIAMGLLVATRPFYAPAQESTAKAHEAPVLMMAGPLVLAVASIVFGLLPGLLENSVGNAGATSISGSEIKMKLALWHGFELIPLIALSISVVTLILGVVALQRVGQLRSPFARFTDLANARGPLAGYEHGLNGLLYLAKYLTRHTQTGSLRTYIRVILFVMIFATGIPVFNALEMSDVVPSNWAWYEASVIALVIAGAAGAVITRSRLSAIALLGVTGLLIAVLFALYSAPDLAITQIMVEALTVLVLVLVFHRLPPFSKFRSMSSRVADGVLACSAGLMMAGLVFATTIPGLEPAVSEQLSRWSKPDANGRNIVNVILVDFRALDTFGEIVVVAMAALGVYAMVKRPRRAARTVL